MPGSKLSTVTSALIAAFLSLVLATPAAAASWDEIPIREGEGDLPADQTGLPGGLITLGSTTAVVMYGDLAYDDSYTTIHYANVAVRRTIDSGATWKSPVILSAEPSSGMAIAGRGSSVDVVWIDDIANRDESKVMYARSTNSAATFGAPTTFASPNAGYPLDVAVARSANSLVVIAWTTRQGSWSVIRAKVSHDGGLTFSPAARIATGQVRDIKLAIGDDAIYAVYLARENDGSRSVRMRRSLDDGASWKAARTMGSDVFDDAFLEVGTIPIVTAEDDQAYVAFISGSFDGRPRLYFRRTTNEGQTWSPVTRLTGPLSYNPRADVTLRGGIVRVAYVRCADYWCDAQNVKYKQSSDGVTWGTPQTAGYSDLQSWVAGVGDAGKVIILVMHPPDGSYGPFGTYVLVRSP